MNIKSFGKKHWILSGVGVFIVILFITVLSNSTADSKEISEKAAKLEADLKKESAKVEELEAELEGKNSDIAELEAKVEEARPWFDMSEKERERKAAEEKKKQEAEKAAAKKKAEEEEKARLAAEEEARKKKEEEEKKGYDTGITYEQLARTPDDYIAEKVKFSGKVIQVMEGDSTIQLRVAVNGDYDKIIYVDYDSAIVKERVLEDDQIIVMGTSVGLITYESTIGGNITIPALVVDKIDWQ